MSELKHSFELFYVKMLSIMRRIFSQLLQHSAAGEIKHSN